MSNLTNVTEVLKERGAKYGQFYMHAKIAQGLKDIVWDQPGWVELEADQKQALEVIFDKVARILNGDPNYPDNWVDIEGYARLVRVRLEDEAQDRAEKVLSSEGGLPKLLRISEG